MCVAADFYFLYFVSFVFQKAFYWQPKGYIQFTTIWILFNINITLLPKHIWNKLEFFFGFKLPEKLWLF